MLRYSAAVRLRAPLFALAVLLATVAPASASTDLACHQQPGDRFFWIERAFCDLAMAGPERAQGLIIWNHGIQGTTESWKAPAPPVLRLAQVRGWDVIMLKRHHLAETMPGGPLDRTVKRTLEEVAAQRKAGYKKIALAGQSFGGYVTLEAIHTVPDIDAAIAFAPGIRASGAGGALDPTITERILQRARVGRLALVVPKDDALFGNLARGERARPILTKRELPWLMVDETAGDIVGHGGGVTGRFAVRYGRCLTEFLAAATLAPGPVACQPGGDETRIVRDLLFPPGSPAPKFMVDPDGVPAELRALLGPRWTLLGDTLAVVAPVDDRGKVRLMYRTVPSGGIWDATIAEGAISAILANKATVVVSPENHGTVTWTSADKTRTLKGTLLRLEP